MSELAEVRLVDADELRRRIARERGTWNGLDPWCNAIDQALFVLDAMPSSTAPKGWTRDEVLAELAKHPDNVCEWMSPDLNEWFAVARRCIEAWHPEVRRFDVRVVRSTPDPEWVPLTKLVGRTPDGREAAATSYGGNADGPWAQLDSGQIVPLTVTDDGMVAVRPEAAT